MGLATADDEEIESSQFGLRKFRSTRFSSAKINEIKFGPLVALKKTRLMCTNKYRGRRLESQQIPHAFSFSTKQNKILMIYWICHATLNPLLELLSTGWGEMAFLFLELLFLLPSRNRWDFTRWGWSFSISDNRTGFNRNSSAPLSKHLSEICKPAVKIGGLKS